jgi:hypothetical protein
MSSALKGIAGALRKALNEPSASDLSASAEQEICNDGTVMASAAFLIGDTIKVKLTGS